MERGTLRHIIDAIVGAGDDDSVTRRIRTSIEARRRQPAGTPRPFMTELFSLMTGRSAAHVLLRDLTLRKRRRQA